MSNSASHPNETGLLAGSQVLTHLGYQPVETLTPGTRIVTRNGMRKLSALKETSVRMRAIRVGQGTLGHNRPSCDMMVAPHQEVFLRNWRAEFLFDRSKAIVPMARLLDGTFIWQQDEDSLHTVYTVCFPSEEVFYANGVEMISTSDEVTTTKADMSSAA